MIAKEYVQWAEQPGLIGRIFGFCKQKAIVVTPALEDPSANPSDEEPVVIPVRRKRE
jgi:hypothetical protein